MAEAGGSCVNETGGGYDNLTSTSHAVCETWNDLLISLNSIASLDFTTLRCFDSLINEMIHLENAIAATIQSDITEDIHNDDMLLFEDLTHLEDYLNSTYKLKLFKLNQYGALFQNIKSKMIQLIGTYVNDQIHKRELIESFHSLKEKFVSMFNDHKTRLEARSHRLEKCLESWTEFEHNYANLNDLFNKNCKCVSLSLDVIKYKSMIKEMNSYYAKLNDHLVQLASICVPVKFTEIRDRASGYEEKLQELIQDYKSKFDLNLAEHPSVHSVTSENNLNTNVNDSMSDTLVLCLASQVALCSNNSSENNLDNALVMSTRGSFINSREDQGDESTNCRKRKTSGDNDLIRPNRSDNPDSADDADYYLNENEDDLDDLHFEDSDFACLLEKNSFTTPVQTESSTSSEPSSRSSKKPNTSSNSVDNCDKDKEKRKKTCPNCGLEFTNLSRHLRYESKSYKFHCEYCAYKAIEKSNMIKHVQKRHPLMVSSNSSLTSL